MSTKMVDLNFLGPMDVRQSRDSQSGQVTDKTKVFPTVRAATENGSYQFARWVAGPIVVALLTELFIHLAVNITTVGFAYLLAILVASTILELRFTAFMCVVAALAYDYCFLPPVGTLNINDPQDWVALFTFLTTALIGTKLAARSRNKAREAEARRIEVERLYTLSNRLLGARNSADLLQAIPKLVAESLGFDAAMLYLFEKQEIFCSRKDLQGLDLEQLRAAASFSFPRVNADGNVLTTSVRLGTSIYGSLALFGPALSRETVDAAAALVAVAIGRAFALEQIAKVEASRENERLKSVLLDAITHDFRTPITSIKISATGLLDDLDFDRAQRKELLLIINEECDRISRLVGEASEMARLECGEVKLDVASHTVGELISAAIADCRNVTCGREISVGVKKPEQPVSIDLNLAAKVLVHLINNSHLYSESGRPIVVSAEEHDGLERITVSDNGPGIHSSEVGLIFEKFYRGKNQRHRVQGTGMGLSIARAIAEAHGGALTVASQPGQGSTFTFSLPIERAAAAVGSAR
jgi:two-component system, OmpR family, sensor histidine kinase KdpD